MQYACRKTLADSRPRVRGRFAKNDEFGEREVARICLDGTAAEETSTEDVRMSLLYDPNHAAAAAAALTQNGRIFTANCLQPPTNPYDMCTTLYCTDSQMRWRSNNGRRRASDDDDNDDPPGELKNQRQQHMPIKIVFLWNFWIVFFALLLLFQHFFFGFGI